MVTSSESQMFLTSVAEIVARSDGGIRMYD